MYTTTTTITTTTTTTTDAAVDSNSTSSNNTIIIIIIIISVDFRTAIGSYLLQNYFPCITKINEYLTVYCNALPNEIILGVLS